jgi:hypothetical protein
MELARLCVDFNGSGSVRARGRGLPNREEKANRALAPGHEGEFSIIGRAAECSAGYASDSFCSRHPHYRAKFIVSKSQIVNL